MSTELKCTCHVGSGECVWHSPELKLAKEIKQLKAENDLLKQQWDRLMAEDKRLKNAVMITPDMESLAERNVQLREQRNRYRKALEILREKLGASEDMPELCHECAGIADEALNHEH